MTFKCYCWLSLFIKFIRISSTGCFFNWYPPKSSKCQPVSKSWHLELFWWDLLCNLTLRTFRGHQLEKTPCIQQVTYKVQLERHCLWSVPNGFYCMLTVHGEGHANQQRKIDWTLLIKPASQLHFKTGISTNYSQRSTRGPAQHHFPLFDDTVLGKPSLEKNSILRKSFIKRWPPVGVLWNFIFFLARFA